MSAHAEDMSKHVKVYVSVFLALMVLTVVTVAVSYLKVSVATAVAIALFVASIKASLVLGYFMHLISERKMILSTLGLTLFFFLAMIFLIVGSFYDSFGAYQ